MLEDESGRVRLIGERIANGAGAFVTGTIMAVLGAETPAGDFEVAELCYAGLPPQPALSTPKNSDDRMEEENEGEWVAIVSGLEMGSNNDPNDLRAQLLLEWLVGELGDDEVSSSSYPDLLQTASYPLYVPHSLYPTMADNLIHVMHDRTNNNHSK
jgi:DNA polymerase delta subunit 2